MGEPEAGYGGLAALLIPTGLADPDGQKATLPIVCRYCGWDQFEVAAGECYCQGCCLPLGIEDGGVYSDASAWELVPSGAAFPVPGRAFPTPPDTVECPAGHDVVQVFVAYGFAADGQVRRLSVGLRCPVDGAFCLYIDNVRVVPRGA
ncbi:hypothetical protein ACIRU3_41105 [Streptomyces sp. NPDC101151]|uniref:hypothetical protein n=1 Tax=Streptomyces sp. NPDC101151 TaxID=3366115 RepID=UPI0038011006